jgi:hypothetical protein
MSTESPAKNRRKHGRAKIGAPIEFRLPGNETPNRCSVADLSEGGCYIEMMQPFAVGTTLELTLHLEEETVLAVGVAVTCDPHVGNGIEFRKMLPEDIESLRAFLATREVSPDSNS